MTDDAGLLDWDRVPDHPGIRSRLAEFQTTFSVLAFFDRFPVRQIEGPMQPRSPDPAQVARMVELLRPRVPLGYSGQPSRGARGRERRAEPGAPAHAHDPSGP